MKIEILKEKLQRTLDLIPYGKENAVSAEDLRLAVGYGSRRELKSALHELREAGAVIIGIMDGCGGFYRPRTPAEALDYVRIERKRLRTHKRGLKSAELYVKDYEAEQRNSAKAKAVSSQR